MKKLLVTTFALGMMLLMSVSVFAAEPALSTFVCPNGNAICENNGQCTSYQGYPCVNTETASTDSLSTAKTLTSDTPSFVCPNGNTTCIDNGACINNGQCLNSEKASNGRASKHSGTGHHRGGQGRGHHGGNRGR